MNRQDRFVVAVRRIATAPACARLKKRLELHLESLESRQLLTASGFQPDYQIVPANTPNNDGLVPAQIRAAYGFNTLSPTTANGAGQTIAIIDAFDDPTIASDLATFDQAYGIAAPPSLKVVNEIGTNLPGTDPIDGWEVETALDVEWAHAIAPGANILLVEATNSSNANFFAAINYARQQPGVSVISMSWGSDDDLSNKTEDQNLSSRIWLPVGPCRSDVRRGERGRRHATSSHRKVRMSWR